MNKIYICDANIENTLSIFSPKLRKIIQQNFPFKSGKKLSLIYDNKTLLIHYSDEYEIHFCLTSNQIFNDEKFLHEFFHCVQKEESFPLLHSNTSEYKNLGTELSSFVLDLDVGDRLIANGYNRSNEYNNTIKIYKKVLQYIEIFNDKTILTSFEDEIGQGGILAHLKYFDIKIDDLLIKTKCIRPKIYKIYQIMYGSIRLHPYNTPSSVYKIYEYLLSELKLQDYFSIE